MLIRDISNDPNQQLIQDYMSVLTGGRTVTHFLLNNRNENKELNPRNLRGISDIISCKETLIAKVYFSYIKGSSGIHWRRVCWWRK